MAMFGTKKEKEFPAVQAAPVTAPEEPAAPAVPAVKRPRGNTITVTKEGSIRGDVAADNYILEGVSEGNAKVSKFCKIGCDGSFTGELYASTLVTEEGSAFEGMLHLKPAKTVPVFDFSVPQEEPDTEAAPGEDPFI